MRLVLFQPSNVDTTVQGLPEPDIVVDPRPISEGAWDNDKYKFEVTVNGTTLTITRINPPEDRDLDDDVRSGWCERLKFRVYNSNEERYSFESTKYLYHALQYEKAPLDTTEAIVKDGVERIGGEAFSRCESLVKVTIPDSVKTISYGAFSGCESLRFIKLPPNLQYIGWMAFYGCKSLEAVFLPPTVKQIGDGAFQKCEALRILNIPDNVVGRDDAGDAECGDSLLADEMKEATVKEQFQWLRNRYNPFHNLCWDPSVSPQAIMQYIQDNNGIKERASCHPSVSTQAIRQDHKTSPKSSRILRRFLSTFLNLCTMKEEIREETKAEIKQERARTNDKPQLTALHLLAANPSVNGDMITAYLQLAPDVAVMQDNIGMTPLHMLCFRLFLFSNNTRDAIRAYLVFEEGKEAAFMIDDKGKTPLDYLCEKDSDELAPFVGGAFTDIVVWWYDCLDINLLVE